ncbi:MAG TPA: patatin-like phospholipase family protein [Micropepsaceae bacterium]|nr:patatin-like phospholipase family protein [Micropepsaceae bacterium]
MTRALISLCLACALTACGTIHLENTALMSGQNNLERRSIMPAAPDRPVILMAFSGGGTRAAVLAASVLEEMSTTKYTALDGPHVLTQDVKFVSSVSGGSVTAGWLGLLGHPPEEKDFESLQTNFLARDNMKDLASNLVDPEFWYRLAFTRYIRIDALEELFDRQLFHGAKLGEINRPGRPIIVLNATDMAGGETFAFTPQRFDDICTDFDSMPLSAGVASSAAFPILLSPVSLRNYSEACAGNRRAAEWAAIEVSAASQPFNNLPEYRDARYTNDLRFGSNRFRNIDYLHLLDGGLADNLGINSLRSALIGTHDDTRLLRAINDGKVEKLVVIVVNARSDKPSGLYKSARSPGLISMIGSVTSVPVDANTANAQEVLQNLLRDLSNAARETATAQFHRLAVYGITIDFDQIPADTAEHRALRDNAKDVPTSWTLTDKQVQATEAVGKFLLANNPCYRALVSDLGATTAIQGDAAIRAVCPTRYIVSESGVSQTTN